MTLTWTLTARFVATRSVEAARRVMAHKRPRYWQTPVAAEFPIGFDIPRDWTDRVVTVDTAGACTDVDLHEVIGRLAAEIETARAELEAQAGALP